MRHFQSCIHPARKEPRLDGKIQTTGKFKGNYPRKQDPRLPVQNLRKADCLGAETPESHPTFSGVDKRKRYPKSDRILRLIRIQQYSSSVDGVLSKLRVRENEIEGIGGRFLCLAMDKYRLVQEHTAEADNVTETENTNNDDSTMSCEVRITQQGKPRNYISYAMKLFVRGAYVNE